MENKEKIINKKTVLSFFSGVFFTLLIAGLIIVIYFVATSNRTSNSDTSEKTDFLTDDLNTQIVSKLTSVKKELDTNDTYETMIDSIICSFQEKGYKTFMGYALLENKEVIPGIAYTLYEEYAYESDEIIYSSGFVQIIVDEQEIALTDSVVENGIFIIPSEEVAKSGKYLLCIKDKIPSSSGIFMNDYFKYVQISDYEIKCSLYPNERKFWDEDIDLFNYNTGKYEFMADLNYSSVSAISVYQNEYNCYLSARSAYEKIVEIQNANGLKEEETCVVVFSEDILNQYILNDQVEVLNNIIIDEIKDIELKEGQYLMISEKGVQVELTQEKKKELVKERLTNGIINTIVNSLAVSGSLVAIVCTCGTATPVAVAAITITASAGTLVYGTSNLISSGMDIYYSSKDDYSSNSINPLLEGFKNAFKDEKAATIAYHAWGITNSIVASFSMAAGRAVGAAISTKTNIALAVGKSVLVSTAKAITVTGVSTAVNQGVISLVDNITGDIYSAKIAGCVSSIVSGIIVGASLEAIDSKYNISYDRNAYRNYAVQKKVNEIIKSVEKEGTIGENGTSLERGNYGEMKMDQQMAKHGFKKISTRTVSSLNDSTETGIDGVYYHPKTGKYVILDAKAGSSSLAQTADGKQMSKDWIFGSDRLKNSVSEKDYYAILSAWGDGDVILGVCKVNLSNFSVHYNLYDEAANFISGHPNPLSLIGVM